MALFAASPQFASMPPQQAAMMRQQMESRFVNRFVDQTILTAEADKQAEKVTDADIDKMIAEIRGSLQPGTTLEGILKERSMTIEKLRTDIGEDLHIRKLLEKQAEKAPAATDAEVAAFYEENKARFATKESVHARHILLKLDPTVDDAAKAAKKAEIEGYHKQLVDGSADFAKLAAEHSDCPSGKAKGGDLGTFGRGQMVPAFDAAAFAQDVVAIGPVIETTFGYHIVQVLERTKPGETAFEDVKEEITERLSGQGKQAAVEAYLTALREKATIVYGDK
jgi:peptidyl-prolyl cis-trans isomerase C